MAYFCAFDHIVASKPVHGSETLMIPDQVKEIQDDGASKASASVIVTNQLRVVCNGGGGALGHPRFFLPWAMMAG